MATRNGDDDLGSNGMMRMMRMMRVVRRRRRRRMVRVVRLVLRFVWLLVVPVTDRWTWRVMAGVMTMVGRSRRR